MLRIRTHTHTHTQDVFLSNLATPAFPHKLTHTHTHTYTHTYTNAGYTNQASESYNSQYHRERVHIHYTQSWVGMRLVIIVGNVYVCPGIGLFRSDAGMKFIRIICAKVEWIYISC